MKKYSVLAAATITLLLAWNGMSAQAKEDVKYGFLQVEDGVKWVQEDGTFAVDRWIYIGDKAFHVDAAGYFQYGFIAVAGKIYYMYPQMARGWTQIGDDWHYFYPDGSLAKNTVIDGCPIGIDGKAALIGVQFPLKKTELREKVDDILISKININPEMTDEEKISACYWYMAKSHTYKRDYIRPSGDWTKGYALEIFTNGYGNCYRFAAGFAYLLKELGYETKVITGQVSAARGGTTPHSWTEVYTDGNWYVYDTELQYAAGQHNYYKKTYANYPVKPLIKEQEWAVNF